MFDKNFSKHLDYPEIADFCIKRVQNRRKSRLLS